MNSGFGSRDFAHLRHGFSALVDGKAKVDKLPMGDLSTIDVCQVAGQDAPSKQAAEQQSQ